MPTPNKRRPATPRARSGESLPPTAVRPCTTPCTHTTACATHARPAGTLPARSVSSATTWFTTASRKASAVTTRGGEPMHSSRWSLLGLAVVAAWTGHAGAEPAASLEGRRPTVPFFFKQWGGVRKSKAGRELDGKTYDGLPARVELPVLSNGRRLAAIADIEGRYSSPPLVSEPSLFADQ